MTAAFLAFAWLLGICAAAFSGAEEAAIIATVGLAGLIAFAIRPTKATLLALPAMGLLVVLAFGHYEASVPHPDQGVAHLNGGGGVHLRGIIDGPPAERSTSRTYVIRVTEEEREQGWVPTEGRLIARAPLHTLFAFGDLVELRGELEAPESTADFDYAGYLLRRGVTSIAYYPEMTLLESGHGNQARAMLFDIRASVTEALSDTLPEPHASLAAGVLVGADRSMPTELQDDMAATGTSHLVAVSGQNVTMVAALVIAALAWLIGRRWAAVAALALVWVYVLVVGADASVIRAGVMGTLYIAATVTGRQSTAPIALVYAAALMTALNPQVVHEVSFQLSFAATLGLVTLAPVLAVEFRRLAGDGPGNMAQPLTQMLAITLAAIAFTLPITAMNFGTVSLVAPVANLFAVPAFTVVAMTSALASGLALLSPDLQQVAAWIAWLPLEYMLRVIKFFASMPLASVRADGVTLGYAIAWYAVLGAGVMWLQGRRLGPEPRPVEVKRLAVGGALVAVIVAGVGLAGMALREDDEGRISVTVLDVGQGDAILIEDMAGRRVLVDGGPGEQGLALALGRHLPFHDRKIDMIIVSHPQADHVGGLIEVLDSYDVAQVISATGESEPAQLWVEALDASDVLVTEPRAGQSISLAGGRLEVIKAADHSEDINEQSVVLRLTSGSSSYLLTGDLGEVGEQELIRSGLALESDVLKVGHHGSRFSSTTEFLDRVGAEVSVISVGKTNPYGHPSQEVLGRLESSDIYRTDEHGDVTISTDGDRIWIETQRQVEDSGQVQVSSR